MMCVYVYLCVVRGYFRQQSALSMARCVFQCPHWRPGGVPRHGLFTQPQGTNLTDRYLVYGDIWRHFNLSFRFLKVKIQNSKVYVSINKKVSSFPFLLPSY